jgi:hypothetical protein
MTTRTDLVELLSIRSAVVREMEEAGYHDEYCGLTEARAEERQARRELAAWDRKYEELVQRETYELAHGGLKAYEDAANAVSAFVAGE